MNTLQFINVVIMRWCMISITVTIVMMEQQKEEQTTTDKVIMMTTMMVTLADAGKIGASLETYFIFNY
jgi:hypothetical protein